MNDKKNTPTLFGTDMRTTRAFTNAHPMPKVTYSKKQKQNTSESKAFIQNHNLNQKQRVFDESPPRRVLFNSKDFEKGKLEKTKTALKVHVNETWLTPDHPSTTIPEKKSVRILSQGEEIPRQRTNSDDVWPDELHLGPPQATSTPPRKQIQKRKMSTNTIRGIFNHYK